MRTMVLPGGSWSFPMARILKKGARMGYRLTDQERADALERAYALRESMKLRMTMREKIDNARGEWLVKHQGLMIDYICKKTGVPESEVWDYILGRRI